jgi:hypothetical protein
MPGVGKMYKGGRGRRWEEWLRGRGMLGWG